MPVVGAIRVKGLQDLNRAFARADSKLRKEKNDALKRIAEPVRVSSEHLAVNSISNIGLEWSRMRVGVTTKLVYVAPRARRLGRRSPLYRRPNLRDLLLDRAMKPALSTNRDRILQDMVVFLDGITVEWEKR